MFAAFCICRYLMFWFSAESGFLRRGKNSEVRQFQEDRILKCTLDTLSRLDPTNACTLPMAFSVLPPHLEDPNQPFEPCVPSEALVKQICLPDYPFVCRVLKPSAPLTFCRPPHCERSVFWAKAVSLSSESEWLTQVRLRNITASVY